MRNDNRGVYRRNALRGVCKRNDLRGVYWRNSHKGVYNRNVLRGMYKRNDGCTVLTCTVSVRVYRVGMYSEVFPVAFLGQIMQKATPLH